MNIDTGIFKWTVVLVIYNGHIYQEFIPVSICQYLYTAIRQIICMATPLATIITEYNDSRYFKFDDLGKSVDWMWGVGNNVGDLLQILIIVKIMVRALSIQ